MEIPVEGYPYSVEALTTWFRDRHGRDPSEVELNQMMNAMAARDSTAPHRGPDADREGWGTDVSGQPVARS
jgi:hypothetical protein